MKKILISILVVISILLVTLGIGYFIFENHLKSQLLPELKKFIKEQTQLNIEFTEFHFSFRKLLQLEPSIRISDLKIEDGLSVKKIYAKLYLRPLLQKRFEVKELVIENAELILVENSNRIASIKGVDLEKIIVETKKRKKEKEENFDSETENAFINNLVLKKVTVKDSTYEYFAYGQKDALKLSHVNLDLQDFSYDAKGIVSKAELNAKLFNSKNSKLYLKGEVGPFPEDFTRLPVNGNQTLKIVMSDIPQQILKDTFGDMLKPNDNTEIEQNAWLSGDAFGTLFGDGKIKLKNFVIGASDKHTLTANSELPIKFQVRINNNPNLKLEIKGASLDLKDKDSNKGQINAESYINIDLASGLVQGSSSGSITGLELEEALATFVNIENVISGKFELENYQIFFKGTNADELNKSLKGTAKIHIHDGSLYILRSITKYKDIAKSLFTNGDEFTEKLAGNFLDLTSDIEIENSNLHTTNIKLEETDKISITGEGVVKKGEFLVYDVDLKLPQLAAIPINIRGTLAKPSIYPDIKNMGAKQSQQILNQTLQYGLNALNQALQGSSKTQTVNGATTVPTNPLPTIPSLPQINLKKPDKKALEQAGKNILYNVLQQALEKPATTTTTTTTTTTPATETTVPETAPQ